MENLEKKCLAIKQAFENLSWELDGRFDTAVVVFESASGDSIQQNIASIYDTTYDSSSIKKATKEERTLAKMLSGVSGGQLLFISIIDNVMLYGAWWPWGNGENISLRVGFFADDDVLSENDALKYVKQWFAID